MQVQQSQEERRYPARERRRPREWWKVPQSANCTLDNETEHVQEITNHVHYCAMQTNLAPTKRNDNLSRPVLDGVMASDIKTEFKTLREAFNSEYGGYFSDAAHKEFNNLLKYRTWVLQKLPSDRKAIGCRMIFKVKSKDDGTVDRFKARLVVQGFSQRPGIDFDETFAPTAHQESIRLLFALAAQFKLRLRHVDFVGAFLNGDMDTQVFMKQPEGFVDSEHPDWVCELQKALYGLKQAGRTWNKKLDKFLKLLGFVCVSADPCIYIMTKKERKVILALHVDDTLIAYNDIQFCDSIIKKISDKFEITDFGTPSRLLGMRI